jgi:hypothetical protein
MKRETLKDIIERIATAHFGVGSLEIAEVRNVSTLSIKSALTEAIKVGERIGYDEGYNNVKEGCDKTPCDCDDTLLEQF